MTNVMASLPIGGASVQCRKVWLTPTTRVPCSNAVKTRNPLKLAGVPQTRQQISAVSGPKITILSGHVEEVPYFLRPAFPASHVQHISDLHSKFALGPHHVWKYGDIQSVATEIRQGKKERKKERR